MPLMNKLPQEVHLEGVRKEFGRARVLDDVALTVRAGEFLVLLGASGCGKSTLLNVVSGLEAISSGRLVIGGRDMTGVDPSQRDVAMVFQSYALYPTMSARENMMFALRMRGLAKREVTRRVDEMARLLQIHDLLARRPAELSGGQQQRVAIGRALVREPAVFLLDEPLSNLDARLRGDMMEEIRRLHQKTGRTTLYVTHDHYEALSLADRVAVMDKGRIVQCDRPEVVYRRPANLAVAASFGSRSINLVEGTLEGSGRAWVFCFGECAIALKGLSLPSEFGRGRRVVLGFRPEGVRVVGRAIGGGAQARVEGLERAGPDTYVRMVAGRSQVVARVADDDSMSLDQTVTFTLDPERVNVFCAERGRLLN